jgi:hypothetical protein
MIVASYREKLVPGALGLTVSSLNFVYKLLLKLDPMDLNHMEFVGFRISFVFCCHFLGYWSQFHSVVSRTWILVAEASEVAAAGIHAKTATWISRGSNLDPQPRCIHWTITFIFWDLLNFPLMFLDISCLNLFATMCCAGIVMGDLRCVGIDICGKHWFEYRALIEAYA